MSYNQDLESKRAKADNIELVSKYLIKEIPTMCEAMLRQRRKSNMHILGMYKMARSKFPKSKEVEKLTDRVIKSIESVINAIDKEFEKRGMEV